MMTEACSQYRIFRENNILMVDLEGPFDATIAQQYQEDIKTYVEQLKSAPWASLVVFQGNGIFSPEAEQTLMEITRYRVQNNMIAIATVFIKNAHADLQQMQLSRIYQSCMVKHHMFSNVDMAKAWLTKLL